jgi:hypothetical protein
MDFAKLLLAFIAVAFVVLGIESWIESAWRHADMIKHFSGF